MAKPSSKRSANKPVQRGLTAKEYAKFSKAHQNVLLERMGSEFRALGEGHGILRDKIDALDAKLDAKVDGLEKGLAVLNCKVDRLGEKVQKVEDRLDRVEEIVLDIRQRLKTLELRVGALEVRMGAVESGIAGLESKWDTAFESGLLPKEQAEKIRQLEERVAVLEAQAA